MPEIVVADAGYGSEENYVYLENAEIESLTITWPDGETSQIETIESKQLIEISRK